MNKETRELYAIPNEDGTWHLHIKNFDMKNNQKICYMQSEIPRCVIDITVLDSKDDTHTIMQFNIIEGM